ncbi:unnamed protein product [Darwinula stevensoni]|uniref:Uncharacterized protein n=1 Tax=Darwinula stevensoni TaxID=69355 RepID=A0A7R9AB35_9CRUS|nr:unnamed protein product [Darwinula stevensoni]CAG0898899.1 unnamed protein product [Darwinula stevensoni]
MNSGAKERKMRGRLLLSAWLSLLAGQGAGGLELCPPSDGIAPCACVVHSTQVVDVDCMDAETVEDVYRAFNGVTWEFKNMTRFLLHDLEIEDFPEDVLGDVSFQDMQLLDNVYLRSIHPSALLPSRDRLETLTLQGCHQLSSFPFEILPEMEVLKNLLITCNNFKNVPALRSDSLKTLNLWDGQIISLEGGAWSMQSLTTFVIGPSELEVSFVDCDCTIYSTQTIDINCMDAETLEDIYRPFDEVTLNLKEMWKAQKKPSAQKSIDWIVA